MAEHEVKVLYGLVLADMASVALRTVDGVGTVELDAIPIDGQAATEAREGPEGAVLAGRLENGQKRGRGRGDRDFGRRAGLGSGRS